MTTQDFTRILLDSWPPLFLGGLAGGIIVHVVAHRRPGVDEIRGHLGRSIERFRAIPQTRLDAALLSAARTADPVRQAAASILWGAFWISSALFSGVLFQALFPAEPHWLAPMVGSLTGMLLFVLEYRIRKLTLLHRVEHMLRERAST